MRTIAICDDDAAELGWAAETIARFADEAGYEIQLEQFQTVDECLREAERFEVVFMDIEFEDGPEGIEAAARINVDAPNCQIVYLTNYLHYSLDVYHTNHVWYVLKNQLDLRLPEVFKKLAFLEDARRSSIALKPVGEAAVIAVSSGDIRYIERQNRVSRVVLQDGAEYVVREKVADLLGKLPEAWFARCHNSYAVNFGYVQSVRSSELTLDDGTCLPISRSLSKRFRSKYLLWVEARNV